MSATSIVDRRADYHAASAPTGPPPAPDMVWIPGGTFRMGSDRHYPEEAPTRSRRRAAARPSIRVSSHPRSATTPASPSSAHTGFRCIVRVKQEPR
jgi:hypothetical protein